MDNLFLNKEQAAKYYLEWIKEHTFNRDLTGEEIGVKLAIEIFLNVDPMELLDPNTVVSESIEGMSQTFKVDEDGIPIKVYGLLKPYYRAIGLW